MLSIRCPVLPLKSYTFDMPCELGNHGFIFYDMNVSVMPISDTMARV